MVDWRQTLLQGFLLGFGGKWLLDLIFQRLSLKWKAQYDRELEQMRLIHAQNIEIIKTVLGSGRDTVMPMRGMLSNMITSTHDRIVDALEATWGNILRIRDFALKYISLYEIFTREELGRDHIAQRVLSRIPSISREQWLNEVGNTIANIEMHRPFLGETLWTLYTCYRAAALRMVWKVVEGKNQGRLPQWDETPDGKPDNALRFLAALALSESELNELFKPTPLGGPWRVLTALEAKILQEMNLLLFGRRQLSIGIREMEQLERALHSVRAARWSQHHMDS